MNLTINQFILRFFYPGGSGFLGQHIVKHLQEKDDDVKEIRIIDLKPYRNNLSMYNKIILFEQS